MLTGESHAFFRGTTIVIRATFYDANKALTRPAAARVNIVYPSADETQMLTASVAMTPPAAGLFEWSASWDSRGAGPGLVSYSVHSVEPAIPFAVADGQFRLSANNANLPMF